MTEKLREWPVAALRVGLMALMTVEWKDIAWVDQLDESMAGMLDVQKVAMMVEMMVAMTAWWGRRKACWKADVWVAGTAVSWAMLMAVMMAVSSEKMVERLVVVRAWTLAVLLVAYWV